MNTLKLKGTRHRLLLTVCLLLLSQSPLFAQPNYQPGYVVTTAGDTLHGFIDYREWVKTPTSVSFSAMASGEDERKREANNTRYFEITGMEAYQRYEGPITMNPVNMQNLPYTSTVETANVSVFLKVLQTGKNVKLLSYNDNVKTRYFVQEYGKTQPLELYYNKYYTSGNQVNTQRGYIGQLLLLASKYEVASPKFEREIKAADYNDYDFRKIIGLLNGKTEAAQIATKKGNSGARYFAGIGINREIASVRGNHKLSTADLNSVDFSPRLAVGADIFLNRHVQKILLRLEASLAGASYTIEKEEYHAYGVTDHTYELSQRTASLSPQFIYNLYNKLNLKAYLGLAAHLNYSFYSDNIYTRQSVYSDNPDKPETNITENYMKVEPLWTSFSIHSGVVVNRKYELWGA